MLLFIPVLDPEPMLWEDRPRPHSPGLQDDELDGVDEGLGRAATVRFAISLDDAREGERDIEHIDPGSDSYSTIRCVNILFLNDSHKS